MFYNPIEMTVMEEKCIAGRIITAGPPSHYKWQTNSEKKEVESSAIHQRNCYLRSPPHFGQFSNHVPMSQNQTTGRHLNRRTSLRSNCVPVGFADMSKVIINSEQHSPVCLYSWCCCLSKECSQIYENKQTRYTARMMARRSMNRLLVGPIVYRFLRP